MKIKHNITRQGSILSGRILETIFEEGENRGETRVHYTKDRKFSMFSSIYPYILPTLACSHSSPKESFPFYFLPIYLYVNY